MSFQIGIGFSKDENPFRAAQDAAVQAKIQIHQGSPNFILVFTTIEYSRLEALNVIKEMFPDADVVGCSTSALILSNTIETRGISILAISSKDVRLTSQFVPSIVEKDAEETGGQLAEKALKEFGLERRLACLLFLDGLFSHNHLFLKGFREKTGQFLPVVGAGSSDDFRFSKTYQYYQNGIISKGACCVILGGQMSAGISSQHGWKPLGKPRTIDEVEGNIIKTINGKKAVLLYEEFFAGEAISLFSGRLNRMRLFYPLGIHDPKHNKYLLQHVVEVLPDGSLVCQGEVTQGAEVHIMIGNKESCKQATLAAACEVKEILLGRKPSLILVFQSSSRQKLLGRKAFQEIQTIQEVLGETVPLFGMSSYGEIAPLKSTGETSPSFLQNETITILAIEHHKAY